MKKLLILSLALLAFQSYAQEEKGMHFEHGSTWTEIKAKAKKENKYIFVDAYTTWCGPCKYMSANIFPMEEVGKFFNAGYINVKVQIDSTKTDNEEVKKWYADARDIAKTYKITAYPTYLFFSPDGEIVHRAVGSSDASAFIAKAKDAMNPEKQYYTLKKQYESGKKDPQFLRLLANASMEAYDREFSGVIIKEYLATQKDFTTPENIRLLSNSVQKSTDPGFDIFRKHPDKADSVLGNGASSRIVSQIALREIVYPVIFKKDQQEPDWLAAETNLKAAYPDMVDEILLPLKAQFFQSKKNWPEFNKTVTAYLSKFSDKVSHMQLNNFAWSVFENCEDGTCVEAALAWSKKSLSGKDEKNPMFMDTYANLLYKTGKKAEAIKLQEEAVQLANNDANMKATLDKMKKGEKTW